MLFAEEDYIWTDDHEVISRKLIEVARRMTAQCMAPGPDMHGRAFDIALQVMCHSAKNI